VKLTQLSRHQVNHLEYVLVCGVLMAEAVQNLSCRSCKEEAKRIGAEMLTFPVTLAAAPLKVQNFPPRYISVKWSTESRRSRNLLVGGWGIILWGRAIVKASALIMGAIRVTLL
jgi:hypothetical protein